MLFGAVLRVHSLAPPVHAVHLSVLGPEATSLGALEQIRHPVTIYAKTNKHPGLNNYQNTTNHTKTYSIMTVAADLSGLRKSG